MPKYDYHCEANGQTVEVQHRMSEEVTTWGDLCQRAGHPPGDTAPETPVQKAFTRSSTMKSANRGSDSIGGSAFGAQSVTHAYHSTKNF